MKTEQLYNKEIAKEINRVLQSDSNKENYRKLLSAFDLKAKSCTVKIGWRSGTDISFTIGYEKGASNIKPFDLFVKNIEDKAEIFGFLCGLFPDILDFNPMHTIDDEKNRIVTFKLKRNE